MRNLTELTGKRILVTGASSGIGRETAVLFSQLGASVVINGRDEKRLDETFKALSGDGHRSAPFDLSECDQIGDWLRKVTGEFGQLHAAVHMAGIYGARPLKVADSKFVETILNTNVSISLGLVKAFRHKKVRAESSSIVLAASVAGLVGQPAVSAYSASKGAIIAMTKSLAMELARENIRVNCVSPSMVVTEMTNEFEASFSPEQMEKIRERHPLGFGKPEDVAALNAFLVSDASSWMTGSNIVIDGGYSAG